MYENIFNAEVGKKLLAGADLDKELAKIKKRTNKISKAATSMSKDFSSILQTLGSIFPLDMKDPNLMDTPNRIARAWIEMISGLGVNPDSVFGTSFPSENYDQIIILKNIHFTSLCSHHFMPFSGLASVGYLPDVKKGSVCGISKLARLVDIAARRPQLQERMCDMIIDGIKGLNPAGAIVVVSGSHGCISCSGVRKQGAKMITSAVFGEFTKQSAKLEFFELLKIKDNI